jgi:PleD family two-component response regulator
LFALIPKCSISRCSSTFAGNVADFALEYAVTAKPVTISDPLFQRGEQRSAAAVQRIVAMPNARKILIVDDDTDLREALVEQLSLHEEFEASAVDTGAKGATAAKANSPDLVLMDVGLPDMDGREVGAQPAQGRLQGADHHADRT